jgi:hypothetical protein
MLIDVDATTSKISFCDKVAVHENLGREASERGRAWHLPAGRDNQAVFCSARPSSSIICSRMMNFCTLPVTVIGKASTNLMYRGIL